MNKLLALPITFVVPLLGAGVLMGGNTVGPAAGVVAAAAACVYANPSAERVAVTMEALTDTVVDEAHWDTYSVDETLKLSVTSYTESTIADRHQVLVAAVRTILDSTPQASVSTPPLVWWNGATPTSDTDTEWEAVTVPGWDGNLASYLAAYANEYAVGDDALAVAEANSTSCVPASSVCGQPSNVTAILATIRHLESGDNYTEYHRAKSTGYAAGSGWPSGAYQFIYSTWAGYGGYDEAYLAPTTVQDERAIADIAGILDDLVEVQWVPIAWYIGSQRAARVKAGEIPLTYLPNPAHNTVTIGDYQTRWMDQYVIELTNAGATPTTCPVGAAAVIAWTESQLGAPYAAIGHYRFGNPTWPGGTLTGDRGRVYTFPAGTAVYDCSGFVIAAYAQAGLDFRNQGIWGSQAFKTPTIPDAPRSALLPGDIAVYAPDASGIGHLVMIHHVEPSGVVKTIEASVSYGVHIGTLNWARVTAIKRPVFPISDSG